MGRIPGKRISAASDIKITQDWLLAKKLKDFEGPFYSLSGFEDKVLVDKTVLETLIKHYEKPSYVIMSVQESVAYEKLEKAVDNKTGPIFELLKEVKKDFDTRYLAPEEVSKGKKEALFPPLIGSTDLSVAWPEQETELPITQMITKRVIRGSQALGLMPSDSLIVRPRPLIILFSILWAWFSTTYLHHQLSFEILFASFILYMLCQLLCKGFRILLNTAKDIGAALLSIAILLVALSYLEGRGFVTRKFIDVVLEIVIFGSILGFLYVAFKTLREKYPSIPTFGRLVMRIRDAIFPRSN